VKLMAEVGQGKRGCGRHSGPSLGCGGAQIDEANYWRCMSVSPGTAHQLTNNVKIKEKSEALCPCFDSCIEYYFIHSILFLT